MAYWFCCVCISLLYENSLSCINSLMIGTYQCSVLCWFCRLLNTSTAMFYENDSSCPCKCKINKSCFYFFFIFIAMTSCNNYQNLDGINPAYWPKGSGNLSRIFQTQQEGITFLCPAPRRPCVQRINCLYAWWRLAFFISSSSSKTKMSRLYSLAKARTPSSKMSVWNC